MVRKATAALIAIVVVWAMFGPVGRTPAFAEPTGKKRAQAVVSPAPAEPVADSAPPGYDDAITRAFRAFETSHYNDARASFLEAHALYPNARTLRALGKTEYELSHYVNALGYLEDSLRSNERPLTPEQRIETEQLCDQLRGYVARFTVSVRPSNATVTIDDAPFVPRPDGAVLLAEGEHELEVSVAGYQSQRHTLHTVGGGEQHLDIVLLALPAAAAPVAVAPRPSRRRWAWAAVGGVVIVGAITGALIAASGSSGSSVSHGTTGEVIRVPASVTP